MTLYVDGRRVAQRADTTSGQAYPGLLAHRWRQHVGWRQRRTSPARSTTSRSTRRSADAAAGRRPLGRPSGRTLDAPGRAGGHLRRRGVRRRRPDLYWRLGESTGTVAADSRPALDPGTYRGSDHEGPDGRRPGTANTAVRLQRHQRPRRGTGSGDQPDHVPRGALVQDVDDDAVASSSGSATPTTGSRRSYDRHVYMENRRPADVRRVDGRGQHDHHGRARYNNNAWHHVVATQSTRSGMTLYVDGALQGTNPQTGAQAYTGYWRIGGDTTWGPQPWFAGTLDEVAVYSVALTPAVVAAHYRLGSGASRRTSPRPRRSRRRRASWR